MPLTRARGNMYPWVTHTHTCLGGECPHKCSYCYVENPRFGRAAKYTGPLRLLKEELDVDCGMGRVIFAEHMNDLFAESVPPEWIHKILNHHAEYPKNTWVYQTKNPGRLDGAYGLLLPDAIVGTTIETNRDIPNAISLAPRPIARYMDILLLASARRVFVTVEPIMEFDLSVLSTWILKIHPLFVNIGADSKRHNLPEPSEARIVLLIDILTRAGIEVRLKPNLARLLPFSVAPRSAAKEAYHSLTSPA